jgi:hypothetical protein
MKGKTSDSASGAERDCTKGRKYGDRGTVQMEGVESNDDVAPCATRRGREAWAEGEAGGLEVRRCRLGLAKEGRHGQRDGYLRAMEFRVALNLVQAREEREATRSDEPKGFRRVIKREAEQNRWPRGRRGSQLSVSGVHDRALATRGAQGAKHACPDSTRRRSMESNLSIAL